MKKFTFALIFSILSLSLWAQMSNPVQFSVAQKQLSTDEYELIFTGQIEPGWHVYSTDIPEGGPTAATLTLEKSEGVELQGSLTPRSKVHTDFDALFGMEISYMEGEAVFVQKFKVKSPSYTLSGYFTYGACNDQNCTPPTTVDFAFNGEGAATPSSASDSAPLFSFDTLSSSDSNEAVVSSGAPQQDDNQFNSYWRPVIEELKAFSSDVSSSEGRSLLAIFFLGFLGGFVALFTPCVWPIIPMTVSFFLKRSGSRQKGLRDAFTYGASIVVIYVLLGLIVTGLFGASALNALSTHAVFNLFFCLMLLVFAASFFGAFELTLPSSWSNAVDSKAESTTGLLSIFLMAFTLSLVSFSCTGPIIGFLLVEVSTTGTLLAPTIGMLGFAFALALPFTLFALFPAWLKQAPRSGGWMNTIKVTLGFLELAFALKFLSVADLAYGWRILDREVFLVLWILIFALLGFYLLGKIRFPHDEEDEGRISVPRFFMALISLSFALYMVPGLWGAPLKAISAFAPPMSTQDFSLYDAEVRPRFTDYDEGMEYARRHRKPVMLDFTGYGCVNCRKMEIAVWTDSRVAGLLNDDYVLITLHVDDKTPLSDVQVVTENGTERKLRTVGDRWSYLQRYKFGANAQPFYVLLNNDGKPLNHSYSFDESVDNYITFLETGLKNYKQK